MNDLPGTLELLSTRVDALEKRVHALEHPAETEASTVAAPFAPAIAMTAEETAVEQAGGVFPVLGRAMLGIAGAYVLRAVAESSSLPKLAIACAAILYAAAWLVWSARSSTASLFVRLVYAGTSALILAPMLWELVLHFKIFSPSESAMVIAAFVVTATLLSRKSKLAPVAWVAHGAAALTALTLLFATRDVVPFVATLLLMIGICEFEKVRGRERTIWPLAAAVTDVAIWAVLFVYSGPQNARMGYPNLTTAAIVTPAFILFLIAAASVVGRTLWFQKQITVVEAIQALIAFLLAVSSVLFFVPQRGTFILGIASLVLSAAGYTVTLRYFRHSKERRNFFVFGGWSAGLLLAGALWCLPPMWATVCLGLLSFTVIVFSVRMESAMLEFHGIVFLIAAAVMSHLPQYEFHALAGSVPEKTGMSVYFVSACALLCYAAARESIGEIWQSQILHFVSAFLASCALAALLAHGLLSLAGLAISLDVFHVAFVRTLSVCAVALALAFGGSNWRRPEMTRIAYAALVFVAAKLLFEDLRHGRMAFIAGSIFLFALTLIAVPRLVRMRPKTPTTLHSN